MKLPPRCCPLCRQVIVTERSGVRLSPLKAAIFDAIKRAGDDGVSGDEIANGDIYRDRRRATRHTIKAHVWQINSLLAATDFVIVSDRRRWFLKQRFQEAAE